jgi:hypothetical protein
MSCVILPCWLLLFLAVGGAVADEGEKDNTDEIKAVLKERLENATKLHDLVWNNFAGDPERLIHAKSLLLKAQLELCATKAERLKVYEKALKGMVDFEKGFKKAVDFDPTSKLRYQYDTLRYAAYRLELKLAFEREKIAK